MKGQIGDELRVMEDFEEKPFLTSVMFSKSTPREIVETLISYLEDYDAEPKLHDNKWKVTYTRRSVLDDM